MVFLGANIFDNASIRSSGTRTVPTRISPPNPLGTSSPVRTLKTLVFPEPAKPTSPIFMWTAAQEERTAGWKDGRDLNLTARLPASLFRHSVCASLDLRVSLPSSRRHAAPPLPSPIRLGVVDREVQ